MRVRGKSKEAAHEAHPLRCRRFVSCRHPDGVHCRAAAALVKTSTRFDADITLSKGGRAVDGKSIISLLMLGIAPGDELTIMAEGRDAMEAVNAMEHMLTVLNTGGLEATAAIAANA